MTFTASRSVLKFLLFCNICAANSSIIKAPENVAGLVGSTVQLKCTTTDHTCSQVTWLKGVKTVCDRGRVLGNYQSKYSVNQSDNGECILDIKNVALNDAGDVTCSVVTDLEATAKSAVMSILQSKPALHNASAGSEVAWNDTVQYSCSVTYNTADKMNVSLALLENNIAVSHQNVIPSQSSPQSKVLDVTVNYIVKMPTIGPFECRMTLTPTEMSGDAALNIVQQSSDVLPVIRVHMPVSNLKLIPDHIGFDAGETVKCEADGFPEPRYEWKRLPDNQIVARGSKFSVNESVEQQTLNYTYVCVASNAIRGQEYVQLSPAINFLGRDPELAQLSQSSVTAMIIGIVVLLLVVPVVVAIIVKCVCFRRHKKQSNSYKNDAENTSSSSPRIYSQSYKPITPDVCTPMPSSILPSPQSEEVEYAELVPQAAPRKPPRTNLHLNSDTIYAPISSA